MPYLQLHSHLTDIHLGLWRIEEDEAFFRSRLNLYPNEQQILAKISHPQKKLEWLASRLCLKTLLKLEGVVESLNNSEGKPYLSDNSYHISYSHSHQYAAAAASSNSFVALDIEMFRNNRSPEVAQMFMDKDELSFYQQHQNPYLFFLFWSAKETLFKIHAKRSVYFREHIHIQLSEFQLQQQGKLTGIVQSKAIDRYYDIQYEIFSDFVLTYTRERV